MPSRFLRLSLPWLLLPLSGCAVVSGVVAVGDAVVGGVLHAGAAVVDTVTPDFSDDDDKPKKKADDENPDQAEK